MDKAKVGNFISSQRKENNLTIPELAKKLGVTEKSISKWEDGISLPDSSIIPLLCELLGITVNDLFSGEKVDYLNSNVKCEINLMDIKKELENSNRKLLIAEIFIIFISILSFILILLSATRVNSWIVRTLMITGGLFILIVAMMISTRIIRTISYYECMECHYKYKPTLKQNLLSTRMGWTKKLKCPNCGKKTLNRKILTK